MPTFCRHNRLVVNCPICSREQAVEMRPIVTSSTPGSAPARERRAPAARPAGATPRTGAGRSSGGGMRVSRLARGADDGFSSPLVPGLRSSQDAARLADELAFAAVRLSTMASAPTGLWAEAADPGGEVEERIWLVFQTAVLGSDPVLVAARRVPWHGEPVSSEAAPSEPAAAGYGQSAAPGGADGRPPRAAGEPERALAAYRVWAGRAGSQLQGFTGEPGWPPERRFARIHERLGLPSLDRVPRFELLVSLGALGLVGLSPGSLQLGGNNDVTVAAKRAFGIGDAILLERRAAELAGGTALPLAALDLGLFNWGRGERDPAGFFPDETANEAIEALSASVRQGLGL